MIWSEWQLQHNHDSIMMMTTTQRRRRQRQRLGHGFAFHCLACIGLGLLSIMSHRCMGYQLFKSSTTTIIPIVTTNNHVSTTTSTITSTTTTTTATTSGQDNATSSDDDMTDHKHSSRLGPLTMVVSRSWLMRRCFAISAATATTAMAAAVVPSSVMATEPIPWPFQYLFQRRDQDDRRQLEVCLVTLLRVLYWAQSLVIPLSKDDHGDTTTTTATTTTTTSTTSTLLDLRKNSYLEARLGAKALVTGKVGGGAPYQVFVLSQLDLRNCLDDLDFWWKRQLQQQQQQQRQPQRTSSFSSSSITKDDTLRVSNWNIELLESLASIVEFDGLETTQDPSPRSSLTMNMYQDDKANYVLRMLNERVIPITKDLIHCFDPEPRRTAQSYMAEYYPNEVISF